MRFITNPVWLGAIAAIVAVLVPIVLYYVSKQKKSLSYEILAENPLISIDKEIKTKLQILLDGNPIENLHLLLIRFNNDGKVPIPAADYERPITLSFKDATNIISAEYVSGIPSNLVTSVASSKNNLAIKPILMNSGDSFTIKVLLERYNGTFDTDTRIIGVNALKLAKRQSGITRRVLILGISGALAFGVIINYSLRLYSIARTPPKITQMNIIPSTIKAHTLAILTARVTGAADLSFLWSSTNGQIEGDGPVVRYVAPNTTGPVTIQLSVIDSWGRIDKGEVEFDITNSEQAPSSPHFKIGQ